MVQALQEKGVSVTVLTNSSIWPGFPIDDSQVWNSIGEVIDIPTPSQPNRLSSIAMAARFQTPFYSRWIGNIVRTAKSLHLKDSFHLIYSRSGPSVSHMAGFWCAKALQLPWVANINDPWVFEFFLEHGNRVGYIAPVAGKDMTLKLSPLESGAHHFWMRRTLRHADLITYPCKGLHSFHVSLAKLEHPAEVIPHIGYKPEVESEEVNGQFRIVHAGVLGASEATGRSPHRFLLGLKAFIEADMEAASRTMLVLVGPEEEKTQAMVRELGLQRNVRSVGRVNYETSLRHISSASVCLLIEAQMKESVFFPSKLADYLVCGKPVLALSPQTGPVGDWASRGELVRVDHDAAAVKDALTALYSEFRRGTLRSRNPSQHLRTELEAPSVANKFLTACLRLTTR
jgi:glycosyltransferase involved in cell wall biosynthesis